MPSQPSAPNAERRGKTTVTTDELGGTRAWTMWSLATIFVVWIFTIQTGYAVVSGSIQVSAQLDLAQISLAASIYTWVFAACQLFSGALLDRFGSRPLLTVAVALVTIGAFCYAATSNFATLALAQVILALGASFGFVGAGYVGGRWFATTKYGLMFALVQTFSSLGSAVGQSVISWVLNAVSWQTLLTWFGIFGICLTVVFAVIVRDPRLPQADPSLAQADPSLAQADPSLAQPSSGILAGLLEALKSRRVLASMLYSGASFGTVIAVGVLWGPRLMAARGSDSDGAVLLTAASWLGVAIGAPLINIVSNRLGARRLPGAVDICIQAILLGVVIYLPSLPTSPAVTAGAFVLMLLAGLFGGAHMLGFTVAGESMPAHRQGAAAALVNASCFVIAGLLQSIPGMLLPAEPQLADYQGVLWIVPVLLLCGALAACAFPRGIERHEDELPAT